VTPYYARPDPRASVAYAASTWAVVRWRATRDDYRLISHHSTRAAAAAEAAKRQGAEIIFGTERRPIPVRPRALTPPPNLGEQIDEF
jgi:hypothetical protein